MSCFYCDFPHGTTFRLVLGARCTVCKTLSHKDSLANFVRDEVDERGRFWHVFQHVGAKVCPNCGHVGKDGRKLCEDGNSTSIANAEPKQEVVT